MHLPTLLNMAYSRLRVHAFTGSRVAANELQAGSEWQGWPLVELRVNQLLIQISKFEGIKNA
jgi:hypothetical protein